MLGGVDIELKDAVKLLMADVWLAACERRVIAPPLDPKSPKLSVIDVQGFAILFGPASGDECRLFIHRMAALDVLRALGTERVAEAAHLVSNGQFITTLNS